MAKWSEGPGRGGRGGPGLKKDVILCMDYVVSGRAIVGAPLRLRFTMRNRREAPLKGPACCPPTFYHACMAVWITPVLF